MAGGARRKSKTKDQPPRQKLLNRHQAIEISDMNVPNYEASYSDASDPGFHLITRVATTPERPERDVIKVTELTVAEGKLLCRFEMLVDDINEPTAEILIKSVLLNQFCDRFFEDKVSGLELFDLSNGKQRTVPYGQ